MDIRDFVGIGGVPLVQALVALVKTSFPGLSARYYPSVSVVFGVVVNLALAYLLESDYRIAVVVGVVTGLVASGLFDYAKQKEQNTA